MVSTIWSCLKHYLVSSQTRLTHTCFQLTHLVSTSKSGFNYQPYFTHCTWFHPSHLFSTIKSGFNHHNWIQLTQLISTIRPSPSDLVSTGTCFKPLHGSSLPWFHPLSLLVPSLSHVFALKHCNNHNSWFQPHARQTQMSDMNFWRGCGIRRFNCKQP